MDILFIQTGGTIDKDYPRSVKGYAFEIGEPAVQKIIERIRPQIGHQVLTLFRKDSSDITAGDRKKILNACKKAPNKKIIITHGTDTIIETAKILSGISDKTIILTGAFKPETFKNSDADFNLGFALGALENAGCGTFIALQGKLFEANNVVREKSGIFKEKKHERKR